MVNQADYEAKWDAAACNDGRVSHAGIATLPLDDVASTVHSAAMHFEKNFGVFWPVKLWEERTQKKSDPKRHRWIQEDGEWVKGLYDDIMKPIAGTIRVKKTWAQGVERRAGVAAKSCAVYEGQVDDMYKDAVNQAVGGLDVKMEKEKDEDGKETGGSIPVVNFTPVKRKRGEASESDDDCDYGLGGMFKPTAAKKALAVSAAAAIGRKRASGAEAQE